MSHRNLSSAQFKGKFDDPAGTVVHEDTASLIAPNVYSEEWMVPTTELHRGYREALAEDIDPSQQHSGNWPSQQKKLLESVRQEGVRNPISVTHEIVNGEPRSYVTNGTHRLMAAHIAGQSTVPVRHFYVGY